MSGAPDAAQALADARAAFARGDFAAAFLAAGRALATPSAEARVLRTNAAIRLQDWDAAIVQLEILLREQPGHAPFRRLLATCWLRVGNRHREAGRVQLAAEAYQSALAADPEAADVRYNFGTLLTSLGRFAEAEALLRALLQQRPDDAEAGLEWARAALGNGQRRDAAEQLRALAGAAAPDIAQLALGWLVESGDPGSARALGLAFYRRHPERMAAAWELATALRLHGYLDDSDALLDALNPLADPRTRLRMDLPRRLGLPVVPRDVAAIDEARARYAAGLEALAQRYPPARIAELAPCADLLVFENFLLAYQCRDDRELQQRYGAWLCASMRAALPTLAVRAPPRRRQPRLLMVSSCFRECTVGSYFFSWTGALVRAGFEVVVAQVGDRHDERTRAFGQAASQLVRVNGEIAHIAARLQELQADIALYPEIGMDGRVIALAAMGLAPVQACAWGHPVTTGLPTMDAFLSCAEMEPLDGREHYSEQLLLLPGLGTRYASPPLPAATTRRDLGLPEGRPLYLVPQSPYKIHPDNDAVLVDVARRDPAACFVLFEGEKRGSGELLLARLRRQFEAAGLQAEPHLHVLPLGNRARYLQINRACDVMLDNLHWSGGNTSLDALHCGLPVVTCPGRYMRGRQSAGMLRRLQCGELIVDTPQALAATAVELAHSPGLRQDLARRVQTHLQELVGRGEPLQVLGIHLRDLLAARH